MLEASSVCVDLVFSLTGSTIPQDHGYSLYASVSRLLPELHGERAIGIFPIAGASEERGVLRLTSQSVLRLRLAEPRVPGLLSLTGKILELDGYRLRVSAPRIASLTSAPSLESSLVIIKLADATSGDAFVTPDAFLTAAKKKLQERGIQGKPHIRAFSSGPRAGEARRRVIRIKGQTYVGYAVIVDELSAEESLDLQEHGLGGRRLMGCGLFLPLRG